MWCFSSLEHAVVSNDAHLSMAHGFRRFPFGRNPRRGCLHAPPRQQEYELAPIVDALEHFLIDETVALRSKTEEKWQEFWLRGRIVGFGRHHLGEVTTLASPTSVSSRRSCLTERSVDGSVSRVTCPYTQTIVLEHLETSFFLYAVMLAMRPPTHESLFVAPGRQRQNAPLVALALEAFVVDEPVDRLELRLELFGE